MEQIPYEKDYYAWILQQAEWMKKGGIENIDWENVLDEFQSPAFTEYSRFKESFYLLIANLLVWQWYHPQESSKHNSLRAEIDIHRSDVLHIFKESPSIKNRFADNAAWFQKSWEFGRLKFGIITMSIN